MGLPSIVSNINGCNEIIKDNYNGLIIPSKNEKSLEEAMLVLVENNEVYDRLQPNTRSTVVKKYERADMWRHLLSEYRKWVAQL